MEQGQVNLFIFATVFAIMFHLFYYVPSICIDSLLFSEVFAPVVWWYFAVQFHGCVERAFKSVVQQNKDGEDFVANIDAVGPMNEAVYRQVQKARQKKALAWLLQPSTARSLSICASLFRASLPLMGILFKCSGLQKGQDPRFTIVDFVATGTSPVERLMRLYRTHMGSLNSLMWVLIRPWSDDKIHDTASAAWMFLGEVFMRSIMVFSTKVLK